MKKVLLTFIVALISLSASAQRKGDFAVGLRGGPTMTKIEFLGIKENYTRWGAGAFVQYNLTDHFRFDLDGIYNFKKAHLSDFTVGIDLQYLFDLGEDVKFFPLVGYALAFTHQDAYDINNISYDSENSTDGGIQLGAGIQFNLGDNCFVSAEYKFQPGILGDGHVVMASVGYRF